MEKKVDIVKLVEELEGINEKDWNKLELPVELLTSSSRDDYIFREELDRVESLIEEMNAREDDCQKDNKLIGIIGSRGSGKTSLLKSIKNILEAKKEYLVLDMVDPGMFNKSLNILEILVSSIYDRMKNQFDFNCSSSVSDHAKLLKDLKSFTNTLSNLRKEEAYFKENNPSIDVLEDIGNRIKFEEILEDLLKNFKELYSSINRQEVLDIVLIIDDIDLLDNSTIYEMINDLQNYLSGKIILILGYREEQLLDSIISRKISDNENLLVYKEIDMMEIKRQSSNLLEKLIPFSKKIYLNNSEKRLNIFEVLSSITENDLNYARQIRESNLEDILVEIIQYRININIVPLSTLEDSGYIFPNNIRGLMQLLKTLVIDMKNDNDLKAYSTYLRNLRIYRKYLQSRIQHILSRDKIGVLNEWLKKDSKTKNYYIYSRIFNEILSSLSGREIVSIEGLKLLDINQIEAQNVCLGDIIDILDAYKTIVAASDVDYCYIYIIKMMYSLELLEKLLEYMEYLAPGPYMEETRNITSENYGDLHPSIKDYLHLVNVKIIPESYTYLRESKEITALYSDKYKEVFDRVSYTDFAAVGDLASDNRRYYSLKPSILDINRNRAKYRNYFNPFGIGYNNHVNQNYTLALDPYVVFGKYWYIDEVVKKIFNTSSLERSDRGEFYLFYSLFDVELFMGVHYYKSKKNDLDSKVFEKVGNFISGKISVNYERQMVGRLARRSFMDMNIMVSNYHGEQNKNENLGIVPLLNPYTNGFFNKGVNIMSIINDLFIESEEVSKDKGTRIDIEYKMNPKSKRERIINLLEEALEEGPDGKLRANKRFLTEVSKDKRLASVNGRDKYEEVKVNFDGKLKEAKLIIENDFRDIDEKRSKDNIKNLLKSKSFTSNVKNRYLITLILLLKDS